MFGIGQVPTGEKDPFALRRHALGVIRLLIEKELEISLEKLMEVSREAFGNRVTFGDTERERLTSFLYERMAGQLREQDYTPQQIEAFGLKPADVLAELERREGLSGLEEFASRKLQAREGDGT